VRTILDRYIGRAVASGTLLVLIVLLALAGFINFVSQLENIGTGRYQLPQALTFVLATLPRNAYEMLPVAVLLGALYGLGALAAKSELLVMRAAGMSIRRLAVSVLVAAFGLMLVGAALGELIAPPAQRYASRLRTFSLNEKLSEAGSQNAWVKDGSQFINIESQGDRDGLASVYIFTLDAQHRLASVTRALSGGFGAGDTWSLYDVRESRFQPGAVEATREARAERATSLRSELIELSAVDPDDLSSRRLYSYVGYLRGQGLDTYAYEQAFWSRLANYLSVLLMAALALPFVFGPLRSAGAGQRLMIGMLIGVVYFVAARTLASSGAVFDLPPMLVAALPLIALGIVVLVGLVRVR
jgi:lipopolysaccharide export system permease protein